MPAIPAATTSRPKPSGTGLTGIFMDSLQLLHDAQNFFHRAVRGGDLALAENVRFQADLSLVAVFLQSQENLPPIELLRIIEQGLALDLHVPDALLGKHFVAVGKRIFFRASPFSESQLMPIHFEGSSFRSLVS